MREEIRNLLEPIADIRDRLQWYESGGDYTFDEVKINSEEPSVPEDEDSEESVIAWDKYRECEEFDDTLEDLRSRLGGLYVDVMDILYELQDLLEIPEDERLI